MQFDGGGALGESGPDIRDIECASADMCVAVDDDGHVYASDNPTGGEAAWLVETLPEHLTPLVDVSCVSTAMCVLVFGHEDSLAWSTDPTGGAAAWTIEEIDSANAHFPSAIDCTGSTGISSASSER